jgi:hypothetical protein
MKLRTGDIPNPGYCHSATHAIASTILLRNNDISYFPSSHVTKPKPFVESSCQDLYNSTGVNIRATSFTV